MSSRQEVLRERSKQFALRAITLVGVLPRAAPPAAIRSQFLRSATAVAANYRASGRARSRREFASRIALVLEEADETVFWLELMAETTITHSEQIRELLAEARELVAIFAASHRTASGPKLKHLGNSPRTPDGPMTR